MILLLTILCGTIKIIGSTSNIHESWDATRQNNRFEWSDMEAFAFCIFTLSSFFFWVMVSLCCHRTFPLLPLICLFGAPTAAAASPYQLFNYTWLIINQAGDVANASSTIGSQPSWEPLHVDLCALAMGADSRWGTPSIFMPQSKPVDTQTRYSSLPACFNVAARSWL